MDYIGTVPMHTDVILFSPYIDNSAIWLNIFEQGEMSHKGIFNLAQAFLNQIGANINLSGVITDSRNTVFCNYFVAKPAFWQTWSELAEKLFALAENPDSDMGKQLSRQ